MCFITEKIFILLPKSHTQFLKQNQNLQLAGGVVVFTMCHLKAPGWDLIREKRGLSGRDGWKKCETC